MNIAADMPKPVKRVCPPAKRSEPGICGERSDDAPGIQPFPTDGVLLNNLDLRKPDLEDRIGEHPGKVRSYKMISVWLDRGQLEQRGSGPNFQGGLLTLCTCRHEIRAEKPDPNEWVEDWWLAGFTSPRQCSRTWLFYLAQVEQVHTTAADLWSSLPAQTQMAKSTRRNLLGDAYQPNPTSPCTHPFDAAHYYTPMLGHSHHVKPVDETWKKDIEFYHSKFKRHAPYLVANRDLTFLWQTPTMYLMDHPRNKSWVSVRELLLRLAACR